MDTEIKNTIVAADKESQYDEKAKKLLSHKYVLAHILIKTVDEFKGMSLENTVRCIEGEPKVSIVPIEPGMTNRKEEKQGEKIAGLNTENSEINEGLIRFDVLFYVRMKDGVSQIIINVELQKDEPTEYKILNRAVFYASRLVSSQKERDFVNSDFNDIKRVFSIWICLNMDENSMDYIHLSDDKLLGSCQWKGGLDIINIVMIGISNVLPEHDEKYGLHRLLGTLFSEEMPVEKRLDIIEKEYYVPVDEGIRKDVNIMCNLSQGIKENAKVEAKEEFIIKMYKKGYTLEQIADVAEKSIEEIREVIEKKEPALV